MLAKEIMCREVITVSPKSTLKEAADLFTGSKISGAPVVDNKGRLVGVLSQTDLVRNDSQRVASRPAADFYSGEELGVMRGGGFHIEDPDMTAVETVMTPAVLSAEANTPVEDLARMMLAKGVHRIVITKGGKLVGIVTSMDMLRALLKGR